MTDKNKNISLNKMRGYSSVFSSTSFSKLIKNDDYSFIDAKIERYDRNIIGTRIVTYYDYIKYIYNILRKYYKNEYIYKNTIINELLLKKYGVKNTVVVNEFRVGNSIADIVLFNGTSKAFEIKTELDSDFRLNNQLLDYSKIFKECYIVTHESLIEKYIKTDTSIGIIALFDQSRSLKIKEIRPAKENTSIDSNTVMKSVRTSEYISIIKQYYGELPEMNSFNMFDICNDLMLKIPADRLNQLFIEQLKQRKTNLAFLGSFYKELRQIGLSMNLTEKIYQELFIKLNKPITI